eukprot:TRINITY_DN5584_c0_g1_i1.p1 TRINITY_DN5584_c0_g1~~TRINITY_DN5584_c0_g1_i1.p1  ORF type:complete len:338 (+),score=70.00 TRINITY_DN5584_c0_g1_i1:72-1085(+)
MPAAAAASRQESPQATLKGTRSSVSFEGGNDTQAKTLKGSAGAPLMMNATAPLSKSTGDPMKGTTKDAGVTWMQFMFFVFPTTLEHPESTGRMELFARYGPVDQDGKLRGGISGSHVHSDLEIRQMITHETREMLFALFKKPRETVEVIVDALLPRALHQNLTSHEIKHLLKDVPIISGNRMSFPAMQSIILEHQKNRLKELLKDQGPPKERGPVVPYQNKAAKALMAPLMKKKLNDPEVERIKQKRLHSTCTLIASMEDQNLQQQLLANTVLARGPGDTNDRWDRYCAISRAGRASYVQARNQPHTGVGCQDEGLSDKYPGVSSLVSSGYLKSHIR